MTHLDSDSRPTSRAVSRRRLLAGAATLSGAVALVQACGTTAAPPPEPAKPGAPAAGVAATPAAQTTAQAPTAAPAAAATTAPAAAGQAAPTVAKLQNVTIKFLSWGDYKGKGISEWINQFTDVSGAKLVNDQVPGNNLTDKVMVSLSSGTGEYDVMTIDEGVLPSANPYLKPLQSYIARDKIDLSDFIPSCLDAAAWKGVQYDLPIDSNIQILYYRKDVLDEAGVKDYPATFTDLLAAAKKLQKPAQSLYGVLIVTDKGDSQFPVNVWTFLTTWGVEIFDQDNRPAFDTQASYDALDFFKSLVSTVGSPGGVGVKYNDVITGMQQGTGVFLQNWVSTTATVLDPQASKVIGKVGFGLPLGEKVRHSMRGIWTMGMTKDGKQQEAAWEFIKWFTSTPQQIQYVLHKSGNATRVSAFQSPEVQKAIPTAQVHLETLQKYTKNRPLYPETTDILNTLGVMGSEVITGQKGSKAAVKDATSKMTDIMKRGGYIK